MQTPARTQPLWREQIGSHHPVGPQTPTSRATPSRATAVSKRTAASLVPTTKEVSSGDVGGPSDTSGGRRPSSDPLLELLSALAGDGTRGTCYPKEGATVNGAAAATKTAVAAVTGTAAGEKCKAGIRRLSSRHPASRAGGGAATVAAAGVIGTGAGPAAAKKGAPIATAARGGPLVVSVVATLRSGDGCYLQEKALLDVRRRLRSTSSNNKAIHVASGRSLSNYEHPRRPETNAAQSVCYATCRAFRHVEAPRTHAGYPPRTHTS